MSISELLRLKSSFLVVLFPKPLEPVSQFRAFFSFVREFADEHRERLGVSRDPERASVQRIETHIADQFSDHTFPTLVVATVRQTRSAALALGFVYAKKSICLTDYCCGTVTLDSNGKPASCQAFQPPIRARAFL